MPSRRASRAALHEPDAGPEPAASTSRPSSPSPRRCTSRPPGPSRGGTSRRRARARRQAGRAGAVPRRAARRGAAPDAAARRRAASRRAGPGRPAGHRPVGGARRPPRRRDWRAGEAYPHGPHGHEPHAARGGRARGRPGGRRPADGRLLAGGRARGDRPAARARRGGGRGPAPGPAHRQPPARPDPGRPGGPLLRGADRDAARRALLSPQPGAGGPGHRSLTVPGGGGGRGRGRRRWWIALVALVLVVAAAGFVAFKLFQPGHGDGTGRVRVVVPQGSTASQVGDLLAERGVVDSSFFFGLRARLAGKRGDLRAGTFTLRRDMSYAAALDALTTVPKSAPVVDVTLPEGPSRRELAPIVRQAGVSGDYLRASAALAGAAPARLRRAARDLEPGGLPLPGDLRAAPRGRDRPGARGQAARRLQAERRQGRPSRRPGAATCRATTSSSSPR